MGILNYINNKAMECKICNETIDNEIIYTDCCKKPLHSKCNESYRAVEESGIALPCPVCGFKDDDDSESSEDDELEVQGNESINNNTLPKNKKIHQTISNDLVNGNSNHDMNGDRTENIRDTNHNFNHINNTPTTPS